MGQTQLETRSSFPPPARCRRRTGRTHWVVRHGPNADGDAVTDSHHQATGTSGGLIEASLRHTAPYTRAISEGPESRSPKIGDLSVCLEYVWVNELAVAVTTSVTRLWQVTWISTNRPTTTRVHVIGYPASAVYAKRPNEFIIRLINSRPKIDAITSYGSKVFSRVIVNQFNSCGIT